MENYFPRRFLPRDPIYPDIMAREVVVLSDSEPELVSLSDSDSVNLEDQREQVVEAENPNIQSDIAKFPGKSRKEIKTARGLWETGTILIHNGSEEDPDKSGIYIPRTLICSMSGRVRDVVPTTRSWPIIEWQTILDKGLGEHVEMDVWPWMPEFVKFLHTGARLFSDDEDTYLIGEWCLAAVLECPKYQNVIMKEILRMEALAEKDMLEMGEDEDEIRRMFVDTYAHHLPRIGVASISDGKFDKSNRLAAYTIDVMVWEAMRGGFSWLKVVHNGGCIANFVARAQVDAAKKSAPRFPPWHVFNRHKYLVNEEFVAAEPKRGGESGFGGTKKRSRAT